MDINNLCEFCHQDMITNPWGCLCNCGRGKHESSHRISFANDDDSEIRILVEREAVGVYWDTGMTPRQILGKLIEANRTSPVTTIQKIRGPISNLSFIDRMKVILLYLRFGVLREVETDRMDGVLMEYRVISVHSGKTVGYWAHGNFDNSLPYHGQPAIFEK